MVTRRLTIDKKLVRRVRGQVDVAFRIIDHVYRERLNLLTEKIGDAAVGDPSLEKLVHAHPLDLAAVLKSEVAAAEARSAFHTGYAKGAVSHA